MGIWGYWVARETGEGRSGYVYVESVMAFFQGFLAPFRAPLKRVYLVVVKTALAAKNTFYS